MKDTIRTASVLEIYNASIIELNSRLDAIKGERLKLNAKITGIYTQKALIICLAMILILFIVVFNVAVVVGTGFANPVYDSVMIIISALMIFALAKGIEGASNDARGKVAHIKENIWRLDDQITSIIQQINEKDRRKKALLSAEEVIVAKDMKTIKDDFEVRPFEHSNNVSDTEKTCPMCAELVKRAAIICRFCGHRFLTSTTD